MFLSRISFKIGFWYSIAFIFNALLLFGLTAYFLMDSLQSKDRDLLNEKINEYSILYKRDGISGLRLRVSSQEIKNARDFVVRLSDKDGKTLFIHSPDRSEDEDAPQLIDIENHLSKYGNKNGNIIIPAPDFGDEIEVVSKILSSGDILQVGKDTEDREEFFNSFTEAYFKVLIPLFVIAILVGGFLSSKFLEPIRNLTQTVQSIRSGNSKARVILHKTKDEFWHLSQLFNQMLEQNESLVQGMKETVDNVAHDLRTPVMRLQNAIEATLRGSDDIEKFRNALIECKENSELILNLLEGIMDISEAEAGTLRLKKEQVSSYALIEDVQGLYCFVAEEKNIKIQINHLKDFTIKGDRTRLIQALSNLVDNAIKYSKEFSTIRIVSQTDQEFGFLKVIDEGVGISEQELPKIWDRLYRTDTSRSSRGLGLGLSLVKAIINAHGGTVEASSNNSGVGSTFTIKFKIT